MKERGKKMRKSYILREEPLIFEMVDEEGFYIKSKGRKIEQVGFYLRFCGQHFIPCITCQKQLLQKLSIKNLHFSKETSEIHLIKTRAEKCFEFGLPFIKEGAWLYTFRPCRACQKNLKKTIAEAKNWTIGNKDYEYPVEFWRKYEIDDDAWQKLEKHKATKEEQERFKDGLGETTYL